LKRDAIKLEFNRYTLLCKIILHMDVSNDVLSHNIQLLYSLINMSIYCA